MGPVLPVDIIFAVAVLLALVSLAMPIARALGLPYTVFIAALGLVLGAGVTVPEMAPGAIGDFLTALAAVRLPSEGLLALFLPPLLFSAGLSVDVRRLTDDLAPVLALAVLAVIVCALLVGFGVSQVTGAALLTCLLLGAIVSTTDAAAVVAIFRELGVPRRLVVLVEGESLFNDAAAIALYGLLLTLIIGAGEAGPAQMVVNSLVGFAGGIATGFVMARGAGWIIARMPDATAAEITITIALAYLSYLVAENYLNASGVMAVVTSAMVFAVHGRTQMSPGAWPGLAGTWRMLDFWATALVFCLAAMIVPQTVGRLTGADFLAIAAVFISALTARAIVMWGVLPLLSLVRLAAPVSNAYKLTIWWGGLRGAVTIALGLAVLETSQLPLETRRFIFVAAVGYVLAALFIKAPTLRPLLAVIGLTRLTRSEEVLRARAKSLAQEAAQSRLGALLAEAGSPRSFLGARLPLAALLPAGPRAEARAGTKEAVDEGASKDPMKDAQAGLLAVTSRERALYLDYFNQGLVTRQVADDLRAAASRIIDHLTADGPEAYEAAMYSTFRSPPSYHLWFWLYRRFRISGPLANYLALRLERLIVLDLAGRDLELFIEDGLQGFIGAEGLEQVKTALAMRREAIRGTLTTLELQYTQYLNALRDRQISRMRLAMETAEYQGQLAHALISNDVFEDLEVELSKRRKRLDLRPGLDIGERLRRMIGAVPLLSGLDQRAIEEVSHMLSTRIVPPGTVVIKEGERGRSMYFLTSGRLHVELPDQGVLLHPGDFVGEMSLLQDAPRNATVIARSFAFMLELRGSDLRQLMRRHPGLRAQLEASVARRASAAPSTAASPAPEASTN